MDQYLGGDTSSPNFEYLFVSQLVKNYDEIEVQFLNGKEEILDKSR